MNENDKKQLIKFIETPKTIYQICYSLEWGFTKAYNELNILVAGKEIKKVKTMSNKTVYHSYKDEAIL